MQYIEYFFGNFWHFIELLLVLDFVFSGGLIRRITINTKKDDEAD